MSLIKRLVKVATEKREHPSDPPKLIEWFGQTSKTASGVSVTAETAMRTATVYSCVNAISEDCAKMPLEMLKVKKSGKEKAEDHPLYRILKYEPNPYMSAYEWKQLMFSWGVGRGEAFSYIERDPVSQEITALIPMRPDRVNVDVMYYSVGGQMFPAPVYEYMLPNGTVQRFSYWQVFHFKKSVADDGIRGRSPIREAAESIGLEVAARTFAARLFSNGAQPAGVLYYSEGTMTDEQYAELRRSWEEIYGGISNANKTAILEEGIKYEKIGMTPEECQFLETRAYQRREIAAGIFRVPGPIIGDYENSTFANMEQLMLLYVQGCLLTWIEAFEEKLWQSLLLPSEQKKYEFKFNMNVLLRADMKTRYESYAIARQWGWMSADDINELEDRDPLPNGAGQEYLTPMNMIPAGTDRAEFFAKRLSGNKPGVDAKNLPANDPNSAQNDQNNVKNEQKSAIKQAFSGLFTQVFERYSNKEAKAVSAAVQRFAKTGTKEDLLRWSEKFYTELEEDLKRDLSPILVAYRQASDGCFIDAPVYFTSLVQGWKEQARTAFASDVMLERLDSKGGGMCKLSRVDEIFQQLPEV